jgi:DNA-binding MarR family transcriptional regulator
VDLKHYYLGYQLKRTNQALSIMLDQSVRSLGVTLAQVNVLLFIDRFPDATMPHVADLAAVTPQAMHRSVMGLERRGFVRRERKINNEKSFFLSLTAEGKRTLDRAEVKVRKVQDKIKEQFTPQEIETLQALLEKYESLFQEVGHGKTEAT